MAKIKWKEVGKRAVGAAAGGIGSELINDLLPKDMTGKTAGLIKMAAGCVLPELMPKNKILEAAGTGLAAAGATDLYRQLKTDMGGKSTGTPAGGTGVKGVEGPGYDVDQEYRVNGTNDYIFGTEEQQVAGNENAVGGDEDINGIEEF